MATIKYWAIKDDYGPMKYTSGPNLVEVLKYRQGFIFGIGNYMYFTGGINENMTSDYWNKNMYRSDDLGSTWSDLGDTGAASATMFMFQSWDDETDIYAWIIELAPFHIYLKKWNTGTTQWDTISTDPLGAGIIGTVSHVPSSTNFVVTGTVEINSSLNIVAKTGDIWQSSNSGSTFSKIESDTVPAGYGGKVVYGATYSYLIGQNTDGLSLRKNPEETTTEIWYNDDYGDWTIWRYLTDLTDFDGIRGFQSQEIENSDGNSIICVFGGIDENNEVNKYFYQFFNDQTKANIFDVATASDDPTTYKVLENGSQIIAYSDPQELFDKKASEFYRNTILWNTGTCFYNNCFYAASGAEDGANAKHSNFISVIRFKDTVIKLDKQSDYESKVEGRLLSQYTNAENLKKLIKVYISDTTTEAEDLFFSLYYLLDVDLEFGKQLDFIGKIIALPRGGMQDWEYKIMLKCKIASNTCDGTHTSFMRLWTWITNDIRSYYTDDFPAKIELSSRSILPGELLDKIAAQMELALSCGVGISDLAVVLT